MVGEMVMINVGLNDQVREYEYNIILCDICQWCIIKYYQARNQEPMMDLHNLHKIRTYVMACKQLVLFVIDGKEKCQSLRVQEPWLNVPLFLSKPHYFQ